MALQKTTPSAPLLLFWLLLSPARRTLPGLVRVGELGMTEALQWPLTQLRRSLKSLEAAGLVLVDRDTREVFIPSAVVADTARNEQAVKAFAADWAEVRSAAIRGAVHDAVLESLGALEKGDLLVVRWLELTGRASDKHPDKGSNKHLIKRGVPPPQPVPQPVPEPPPQPQPGGAVTEAWARLPAPPFAAAAAEDLVRVEGELGLAIYGSLLRELSCSKWLNASKFGLTGGTPTLRRLLGKADLVQRICAGEFRDESLEPSCARCAANHNLTEACPPRCSDCEEHHPESYSCEWRRRREAAERDLERWQRESVDTAPSEAATAVSAAPAASLHELPAAAPRLREMLPAELRSSLERRAANGRAS